MVENKNDKTGTYFDSNKDKTETYGNTNDLKTETYKSKQDETVAYSSLKQNVLSSKEHGLGVGDKLTLCQKDYVIISIISEGTGEAVIYKVEDQSKKPFVLKLYFEFNNVKEEPNPETLKRIKEITDPDILKLHDFGVGTEKYNGRYCFEISDFAEGGDLFTVSDFNQKYTPNFIETRVIPEIFNGIKKLHDFKIYHCDLKPSNIFFKDHDQTDLVIGDYGSAKAYDLDSMGEFVISTVVKGTDFYRAPEQANRIISEKNDYYSIGKILLHLLYPEDVCLENNHYSIDKKKADQITLRQLEGVQIINDFNPSYGRLNSLIAGLTLNNPKLRWGKIEIEKWSKGEDVEVQYTKTEIITVQTVKLPYAIIKTDLDFINVMDNQPTWWEDLFEDVDTYHALKGWLGSYKDIAARKIFDEMIHFYKPNGKEFVKEAAIRFFQPDRDITIDMNSFNFFHSSDITKDVEAYILKLDEIWKFTDIKKIRLYLFKLEFSLKQIGLNNIDSKKDSIVSVIKKISQPFGIIPDNFISLKTQIQDKFIPGDEKTSYKLLLDLFYLFLPARTYQDTKNRKFNEINEIAVSFSADESLFHDKYCSVELSVYLKNKRLNNIPHNDYSDFLFCVFQEYIKSNITVESVELSERKAFVQYNFNKSLTEFLTSKGINKALIVKGDNRKIELETKLIPSASAIYSDFISEILTVHSVNEKSFEKSSLEETKSQITKFTKLYKKENSNEATNFSSGLIVYSIPVIMAIIGAVLILNTPTGIFELLHRYLNIGKVDASWQTIVLIAFIYFSIIVSLIPSTIFWLINIGNTHYTSEYQEDVFLQPLTLSGIIIAYSCVTVVAGFILLIVLFIIVGIGSLFSDYKTDPTVEMIFNFILKVSAFVVLIGALFPIVKFSRLIRFKSNIVTQFVINKTAMFSAVFIVCILTVYSLTDFKFGSFLKNNIEVQNSEVPAVVGKLYIVTAGIAYIRSGPSKNYKIIGQVKKNDYLHVLSKSENDWFKIKYNEFDAYIHSSLIKEIK